MKRWVYCLPMLGVCVPLLVVLLVASAPVREEAPRQATAAPEPAPAADVSRALPDSLSMDHLAQDDPISFLESCLQRYQRDVRGYHLTMQKQERLNGKLQPKEVIDVYFREKPHSVYMRWIEGARKAERALFVEGENNGKMLARPNGALARKLVGDVVERDVDGFDARQSGRYPLNQFGIKKATERTLAAWKAAKEQGKLHVEFLGVQKVKELGDRVCYKLRRTYEAPENDGVMEITIYVDKENWMQAGSVLKGEESKLIGEYFFRDIDLNPTPPPAQFTRNALIP
jgi:hypothetical protein